MKKRQKNALILGLVFLTLIAVFVGVKLAKKVSQDAEETGDSKEEVLLDLTGSEVTRLEIGYQGETRALLLTGDSWELEGEPSLAIDQSYPESMVAALSPLTSVRALGEADKSEYGLSPAVCTLRATAGGSVYAFEIGSYNAANSSYYLAKEGGNEVYLVSSAIGNAAEHPLSEMVEKDSIPVLTRLNGVTLDGAEIRYEEEGLPGFYTPEYKWAYVDKSTGDLSVVGDDRLTELAGKIGSMTWSEVADPLPTEALLTGKYGLKNPALTVRFDYVRVEETATGETDSYGDPVTTETESDETFLLKIGRSYQGAGGDALYYAMTGDSGVVYGIPAEAAEAYLHLTPEALLPTDVLRMDWSTVDSIDVTAGNVHQRIHISTQLGKDENGEKVEKFVYTEDDKTLDHDLTEEFINYLSEMTAETTVFGKEPQGEALLSILFKRKTEGEFAEMLFEITPYDASFAQVSFNGYSYILVNTRDVEELLLRFNNIR